jgi:hypothetical protein
MQGQAQLVRVEARRVLRAEGKVLRYTVVGSSGSTDGSRVAAFEHLEAEGFDRNEIQATLDLAARLADAGVAVVLDRLEVT